MNKKIDFIFYILFFISAFAEGGSDYKAIDFFNATPVEIMPFTDQVRRDAEAGIADAQMNLSVMYSRGIAVEQDPEKSRFWLTKAADQGQSDANYYLGQMYLFGTGMKKNLPEALARYEIAASKGNHRAAHLAGVIFYGMYGASFINIAKSEMYLKTASSSGNNGFSSFLVACLYKFDIPDKEFFSKYILLSQQQNFRLSVEFANNHDEEFLKKKCGSFRNKY